MGNINHYIRMLVVISMCMCSVSTAAALERMPVERLDLQAKLLRTVIKFSTHAPDRLVVSILYADEAEEIAQGNPFIASIRVYEIRSHGG